MSRFQKYLSEEIGIEYKSCMYFFAISFFCCMYQLLIGKFNIAILHLTEIILMAYAMCYIQVYLLKNFDEGEHFGLFEGVASIGCTVAYTVASWLFGWLNKEIKVTVGFALYVCFMYICMFLVNKVKRDIDTKNLNNELEQFKKRGGE